MTHAVKARIEKQLKLGESYTQFSNITTDKQAYFLGLLCADGCIVTPKSPNAQKVIALSLMDYDMKLLEGFKEFLNAPQKISQSKRNYCAIQVPSNKMANDLAKYGIVPRKTKDVFIPDLDELTWSFLRGYFDGDGCVSARECVVNGKAYPRISIIFTTGSPKFASDLCEFLSKKRVAFSLCDQKSYFQIRIETKEGVEYLYNKMYKNAQIYSERKKVIFDEYFIP